MISVQDAENIISFNLFNSEIEVVDFNNCLNKILREDIFSDRDLPPFNRITMDGIAINFASYKKGNRIFDIENVCAAGSKKQTLINKNNCIEIMTGAILPENCDTIIPYEHIEIEGKTAKLKAESVKQFQNIHNKASDRKKGDLLIKSGTKITASEIGVLASVGKTEVKVSKLPKAIIISTGDELVEVNENPAAYQIRKSNVYSIKSILKNENLEADLAHLNDDKIEIEKALKTFISKYDVIILSGGVSKGKFDFIPEVLEKLGIEKLFHKIKQRPGKPFWFGRNENTFVFALPGNPVSSFVCCKKYFIDWLNLSINHLSVKQLNFPLFEDVIFKPDLTYFAPIQLVANKNNQIVAKPMMGNGSGDFANLVNVDGFLQLNAGKAIYTKGECFDFISSR